MLFVYKFSAFLVFFVNVCYGTLDSDEGQNGSQKYRVEGTVSIPFTVDQSWTANTRVIVDGGQRLAFLRYESQVLRRLPVNSSHGHLVKRSCHHSVNSSQVNSLQASFFHRVISSHGHLVTSQHCTKLRVGHVKLQVCRLGG